MKLYVPHLMDDLKLTADWSFTLYDEGRNSSLIALLGWEVPWIGNDTHATYMQRKALTMDIGTRYDDCSFKKPAVIPAGTVLRIKRIFIRQGAPKFDSITFAGKMHDRQGKLKVVRFWAKLDDCNKIEFERVTSDN